MLLFHSSSCITQLLLIQSCIDPVVVNQLTQRNRVDNLGAYPHRARRIAISRIRGGAEGARHGNVGPWKATYQWTGLDAEHSATAGKISWWIEQNSRSDRTAIVLDTWKPLAVIGAAYDQRVTCLLGTLRCCESTARWP